MKTPFRFPLLAGDIATFCHPSPMHDYHKAHMIDGALVAANGYMAVRAERGRWMATDFTTPPQAFTDRLSTLPWGEFPADSAEWRDMDDIRPQLFRFAPIGLFMEKNHRCAPSPIWQVGGHHLIRLSHLQQLSRLPRCQVYAGHQSAGSPAYFRFNGGLALVPQDTRLTTHSTSVFSPTYHILDGYRLDRTAQPKPLGKILTPTAGHLKDWPPAPPSDD